MAYAHAVACALSFPPAEDLILPSQLLRGLPHGKSAESGMVSEQDPKESICVGRIR